MVKGVRAAEFELIVIAEVEEVMSYTNESFCINTGLGIVGRKS